MPANTVILAGTVTDQPYFDLMRTNVPFLRFYLAVPRPTAGHDHVRVVAYGKLAEAIYPRLAPGVGVALTGHLQTRPLPKFGSHLVMEVVAERASLLPPDGRIRPVNLVSLAGPVTSPPWFGFVGTEQRPVLRIFVAVPPHKEDEQGDHHIRVVAYDRVALEAYAYLRPGAEIAVSGRLQVRPLKTERDGPKSIMEVVAERFTFVANVDWETGDRALAQLRRMEGAGG